jgi:predicted CoA-binding protein
VTVWRERLIDDDARLASILREGRSIAVLGARADEAAPAHYVPRYLQGQGYRIIPVNPRLAGTTVLGERAVARLADLPDPVDVVEVFRRPEAVPAHADEILALPWQPRVVWLQLGIRHAAAAERLARAGILVVQDRCMMPDHRRLVGAGGR